MRTEYKKIAASYVSYLNVLYAAPQKPQLNTDGGILYVRQSVHFEQIYPMKAWVTHSFGDMRLEDIPYPVCKPGWGIVRTRVVQPSISEVEIFHGIRSRGFEMIEQKLKRGPQQLFGHEFSADIVEIDEKNEFDLSIGDRVAATNTKTGTIGRHFPGCFAEYAVVPLDGLAKMPDGITDWEVAALQPLNDCVSSIRHLGVTLGDIVLVLGQGVMGLNSSQVVKAAGAGTVIGVDRRPDVLELASKLGTDITINASDQNVIESVMKITDGQGATIVIEAAAGSPAVGLAGNSTVSDAASCVAKEGKILSFSHFEKPVTLDFNVLREKGATYLFPRDLDQPKNLVTSARLVAQKRVRLDPMIRHKLDGIEKIPEAMEITRNKSKYGALNPAQVRIWDRN